MRKFLDQCDLSRAALLTTALIRVCIVVMAILQCSMIGCSRSAEIEAPAATVLPVQTIEVVEADKYVVRRTYSGEVVARQSSELGFQFAGEVKSIFVDEGDTVQANDELACLDTQILEAEKAALIAARDEAAAFLDELRAGPREETIESMRAELRALTAQLELQTQMKLRAEALLKTNAISENEFDELAFNETMLIGRVDSTKSQLAELEAGTRTERIQAQEAKLRTAQGNIQLLEERIEKSVLRAPFGGVVSKRRVDLGQSVNAAQPIVRLIESAHLEARISVPVSVALSLKSGQSHNVTVGQRDMSGALTAILSEMDPNTRTVEVVFSLQDMPSQIFASEIATISLEETVGSKGIWLPVSALVANVRGLWSCYSIEPVESPTNSDNPFEFQAVRHDVVIIYSEADRVFVRGTLGAGDQVITSGTHQIVPGQRIRQTQQQP